MEEERESEENFQIGKIEKEMKKMEKIGDV